MPKKDISSHASNLLAGYQEIMGKPVKPPIPVEDIIERYLGLGLSFEDLEEKLGMKDVLGATYVTSRLISINERLFEDKSEGRLVYTCAHEVGHWVLHRKFVEVAERSGSYQDAIVCRSANSKRPIEWQADYFAACLLMPEKEVENVFTGYYVIVGYFLTGEHRNYLTSSGFFGRVKPKKNFGQDGGLGAFELALRYSAIDLDSKDILGGQLSDINVGLNWYLNPVTRFSINYVRANLIDVGNANIFQMRFQLDF